MEPDGKLQRLGDTATPKCGDAAVDGEAMSRETRDVTERAENLRTRRGREGRGRTPLRIVQTLLRHEEIGTSQVIDGQISLVSHSVPVRVISPHWDEILGMSCRVRDALNVWRH